MSGDETKTPRLFCDSAPMVAADMCCAIVTPAAPAVSWMWLMLLLLLQLLVLKQQQPQSSSVATLLQYF